MNSKGNAWVSLVALLLLAVVLVMACAGCTKKDYDGAADAPKLMSIVDKTAGYAIYRHDETGVYYFCRDGGYGRAVCVMVNADGTPYTGG